MSYSDEYIGREKKYLHCSISGQNQMHAGKFRSDWHGITRNAVSFLEKEIWTCHKTLLWRGVWSKWPPAVPMLKSSSDCNSAAAASAAYISPHTVSESIWMASREQGWMLTATSLSPLSITGKHVQKVRIRNIFICAKQRLYCSLSLHGST